MKECDKQFVGRDNRSKNFYEKGWRDALEMILSKQERLGHSYPVKVVRVSIIEEELEDE